jgi:NADPH-dependent 2,4-dienoyl-CoA reductase/sulfur reductase-like enzyme
MSDVVIIGAGPGGVSAAVCLHDLGIRPLLIDRADHVAASWRGRYDRLKLNTGRQFSHLPNRPYPKGTPTFPTRDQVVAYLDHHAREDGIALRLGTSVKRIDRSSRGWRLTTSAGDIDARQVVVATGYENSPVVPDWQGKDRFTGELMHSSAYRNPGPFVDKQVLVVGAGSSAMEIAHDLATGGAAKVWLAVRTPPNIILRTLPGGLPGDLMATPLYHFPVRFADAIARAARRAAIGDLTSFGLPVPNEGIFSRSARLGRAPAILDIEVIDAIKNSAIEVVAAVSALGGGSVTLADGTVLDPDVVIAATGYKRGLEQLVGHLGVLDERGNPRALAPVPAAEGLQFLGFLSRPSLIGYMGKQSKRMAKQIARELSAG